MLGQIVVITLILGLIDSELQSAKLADTECGYFNEEQLLERDSFIGPTEHQWIARIVFSKGIKIDNDDDCLGVLISKRTVLAPAHCFVQYNGQAQAFSVHLGVYNKSAPVGSLICEEDGFCVRPAQEIKLAEVAIHPEYDSRTLKNSLAVLTLQRDAKIYPNVMPICMPPPHLVNETLVGQTFLVAGLRKWEDLRQMSWVNSLSRSFCQSKFSTLLTSSTTVCGYQVRPDVFVIGAPLVGMQAKGQFTQNYYLVGLMIDWRMDEDRVMSSFLAIRNYLGFIHQNSDSLIVRS
ncbi:CLIP domain-containing serine protease B9-like [Drosophila elegans]|uniref:CLIP domain-containing serine protease B9-like n=1 Tax=Drosophila elegans TaxID=30023 RepID=UPI0007E6790E|nr:CLIP domain-containing serine protease B9-like [Drosophila elegans]